MGFLRRLLGRGDDGGHHHLDEPVPGWDAINAALEPHYGDQEPLHWGTVVRWRVGGPDPLDGLSAYRAPGPPPHWHYVSYGLSELYAKESDDPEISGWGMELTFRLARGADDTDAPLWPVSLMQNLARYVFESGNVLGVGDHLDLNGPIALDEQTEIVAIAFAEDDQLGTIDTPHGSLTFVQIVGVTMDEYEAVQEWDTTKFLEILRARTPLLVTDLGRGSILGDGDTAAAVQEGTARDGSSMGQLNTDELDWDLDGATIRLVIGATTVPRLLRMLKGRLPFDLPLLLRSESKEVAIAPAGSFNVHHAGAGEIHLDLPKAEVDVMLHSLRPEAGSYPISERLVVVVNRSVITDQQGREVKVIG